MFKKKPFFIVFEGIEGSGKSYQAHKLYKNLKKKGITLIITREPGGTEAAERIRELILKDYFYTDTKKQFDKYTDTLLYMAARNEHVKNKIIPAIKSKKVIICDRFIDSTFAYQVYGKKVNNELVGSIHKHILGNLKPNLTVLLKVNINKAIKRIKKRRSKNRYDKFKKKFYIDAQKAFLKLSKTTNKRYLVVDNSDDSKETEKKIYDKVIEILAK
tara:strand:- start:210 stop:857 length:648 start_codon:yes stop_codon:yes gene_type:complete